MIHWSISRSGLAFGLNPSTKLLWGETSWAMASALLLFGGIRAELPWLSLSAAGVSLWAWTRSRKHYRQIIDIPTAKLSAAPQGYVEVAGTGESHPDYPVVSPLTGLPCLWYEYSLSRGGNVINSGTSTLPFTLRDGKGRALVVPEGARIITKHNKSWRIGDEECRERVLLKNEAIYVLGDHVDALQDVGSSHYHRRRNALLAEWKNDQENLKNRFDGNQDGHIDNAEWENARRAAEIEALLDKTAAPADELFIRKPLHGRPFLISNYSAKQLAKRFQRWSWLHLSIFFAALLLAV